MSKKPVEYAKVITQHKITIPKEIRNFMNLNIGDWIIFEYNDDKSIRMIKSE